MAVPLLLVQFDDDLEVEKLEAHGKDSHNNTG